MNDAVPQYRASDFVLFIYVSHSGTFILKFNSPQKSSANLSQLVYIAINFMSGGIALTRALFNNVVFIRNLTHSLFLLVPFRMIQLLLQFFQMERSPSNQHKRLVVQISCRHDAYQPQVRRTALKKMMLESNISRGSHPPWKFTLRFEHVLRRSLLQYRFALYVLLNTHFLHRSLCR